MRCFSPVMASTLIYPVSTPSLVAFFVLLVLLQRVLLLLLGKGREEVVEQKETPFHPAGHRPPPPSSNRRCYCYHHRPLLVSFSSFLFDPPLFAPPLLLHRTRREFRDGGYLLVLTDIAVLPLRGGSIQPVVAGFFPWGDPTLC